MTEFNEREQRLRESNIRLNKSLNGWRKSFRELENVHLDLATKYQQEVGEPRRLLMQVSELMKQLNWQDVKEPPELVELYATLDQAIRSACRNRVLPHGEPSE
jgi:hypothetical protein